MPHEIRAKHYEQALAANKKFQRFFFIERADVIEERDDRIVKVVFSSDSDVQMWFGIERLLHGTDNVDLEFFNSKMSPLLIDHRRSSDYQIGVIESASVDGKQGYADVRFGEGAKADEYYKDVVTGIRSCISVGYLVDEWEVQNYQTKNEIWIATKWTPREVSLVTLPADDTVGVIRAERSDFIFELQNEEDDDMLNRNALDEREEEQEGGTPEGTPNPEGRQPPAGTGGGSPQSREEGTEGGEPENSGNPEGGGEEGAGSEGGEGEGEGRGATQVGDGDNYGTQAHQIFEMARQLELPDERAYEAVRKQQPFAEFAMEVTKELTNARVNAEGEIELDEEARYEGLDVEEKDAKQFRISHLIASQIPDLPEREQVGGFEREICEAETQKRKEAGMQTQGFAIPGSIVSRSSKYHQQRALSRIIGHRELLKRTTLKASVDATAGHLVDTELRPEALIEWLYGEFAVSRAATWLTDAKGNIAIPKQNGRTVATWGAETDPAGESNPAYELLSLSPKELKVLTPFTKTFAIQSSLDAENLVRGGIMRGLGESLDTALLYGTGGQQIKGVNQIEEIKKTSNPAQRINYSKADGITYENCLEAVEKIGLKNAAGPGMEWITSWAFWKQAKGTAMLENGSVPIWHDGKVTDFMATQTSQVKQGEVGSVANADHAWVANWVHLMVAMWGGMDLVVDPFTLADKGMIRVVGFYRVDSAFAHDEAFVLLQRTA